MKKKILNSSELRQLERICQASQYALMKAMYSFLQEKYKEVYYTKKFLIAVGDIPVALVAHLDTVFKQPPQRIFYDKIHNVIWSPEGLGADDRAGIFSIVQIVKDGFRPTIILTTDEEKGCLGAQALAKYVPEAPTKFKYILELDRKGYNDCVFYECDNPAFTNYIQSFGFEFDYGSFSDISEICPKWGVAGANLSIGYYDEHSVSETLYVEHMFETITKVENMLKVVDEAPNFEYIKLVYEENPWGWSPAFGISLEDWIKIVTEQAKCDNCLQPDYDYNLFPLKGENGNTIRLCMDCIGKIRNIEWCERCGEGFLYSGKLTAPFLCKDCRGKENELGKN